MAKKNKRKEVLTRTIAWFILIQWILLLLKVSEGAPEQTQNMSWWIVLIPVNLLLALAIVFILFLSLVVIMEDRLARKVEENERL